MNKFILSVALLIALPAYASEEQDHAIHQELRAILLTVETAINDAKFDAMLPVISQDIRATTINQEVISSRDEVTGYFNRWFGPGGYLKKLHMTLHPDALTELSADKSWGLVRGSGVEVYTLSDGRVFDMLTRWTAVMQKDADGKWRLRSIHIGTNFLDNPILSAAKNALRNVGLAAGGGGILAGGVLGFFIGGRRKK
jgi:ketosteroid isomerase-like protein